MSKNTKSSEDAFEAIASKVKSSHKKTVSEVLSLEDAPATSLISMTKSAKKRYTEIARNHQVSLSVMVRMALEEYIQNHNW